MKSKVQFLSFFLLLILSISCSQSHKPSSSLYHRVMLLNWADSLDVSAKTEMLELFKRLPIKVDGFDSIEINKLSNSKEGYEHVLILNFSSKQGIEMYEKHSDHLRIQELVPPLVSGFLSYEY